MLGRTRLVLFFSDATQYVHKAPRAPYLAQSCRNRVTSPSADRIWNNAVLIHIVSVPTCLCSLPQAYKNVVHNPDAPTSRSQTVLHL